MTKTVKRKKRRVLKLQNLAFFMVLVSTLTFLFSSLFLRSYNNSLSTRKQELEAEIASIELQNDALNVEISQLTSTERVDEIAANSGLTRDQNNIITIASDDDGE
ncbi:MAG: hypothetical protein K6G61_10670 [Solobacterium sp.]|nr:hypothetical protein [Solobacterium sp.]